jgi:hypothetical protein
MLVFGDESPVLITIVTHIISKLTTEDENGFFTGEIEWI